jgi:serine/threonine protein kinase
MIGTTVGSYRIVERLGAGGMGEVYRAQHLHLDRQAAIKILLVELSRDREAVERFFAEARATSSIRHPGIVDVLDCNVHEDGRVYLVIELLTGETLSARLARDPTLGDDLLAVLDIADQVANAIGAAHDRGIVHRDLKPENVFLVGAAAHDRKAPRAKVLDFGIAKLSARPGIGDPTTPSERVTTRADRLLGTPAYMSPEQCRDPRVVDHRTDIYALGCVLFEMVARRTPFVADSYGQLVAAHLWEPPPPLSQIRPRVATPFSALVGRMLAKDPAARPATMSEVQREIAIVRRAIVRRAIPRPAGRGGFSWRVPWMRLSRLVRSHGILRPPDLNRRRAWKIPRSVLGMVGLAGALAVAIAVRVAIRDQDNGPPPPPAAAVMPPKPGVARGPQPRAAAAQARWVRIDFADAPPGLSIVVDGRAAIPPPLTLPRGPAVHDVAFRAAGYEDMQAWLDGRTNRRLTLGMHPVVRGPPRDTRDAAPMTPAKTADRQRATRRAERPATGPTLSDDQRKL